MSNVLVSRGGGGGGGVGPQGPQGFQGPIGQQGFQGFQGVSGPQGFQGFQGIAGPQGNQGAQGFQGSSGTPAPPDTSVQFNDSGAFGGSADLEWDGSAIQISGAIASGSGTNPQFGIGQTIGATKASGFGYKNTSNGTKSSAFGYNNSAGSYASSAFGYKNIASNANGCAFGWYNIASGNESSAFGSFNTASSSVSAAFGTKCIASANYANAFGYKAVARIQKTTNLCGPIISRKDNGETPANAFYLFCGATVSLMTAEVDFTQTSNDQTIAIPTGAHFFPSSFSTICTVLNGTLTTQPQVHAGNQSGASNYLAASLTTALTAAFQRQIYSTLLTNIGATSLVAGVSVAAVLLSATSYRGRFVFEGLLIEDE